MHLWVTRPQADAVALRARLIAQGHEVWTEPLLTIEFDQEEPLDLDDAQALIATSKNGLRAAAERPEGDYCKELPLYVVGRGTAAAAEDLGFRNVIEGPARARDLVTLIANTAGVNEGTLVHLSGAQVAYNLTEELQRLGYHVLQPILYHARMASHLSDGLLTSLTNGRIEGVLLLSPRTAIAYVRLVKSHQILRSARMLSYFCLSQPVVAELGSLQPEKVFVPDAPNIEEMLALTDTTAAK